MSDSDHSEFYQQAKQLLPQQYSDFKRAIETGKWPDGAVVTSKQRELMLQAIIVYEHANPAEKSKTGQIDDMCASKSAEVVAEAPESINQAAIKNIIGKN